MGKVVAHVVTAEGQHGHWIAPQLAHFACGSSGCFATRRGREKGSVSPIKGFGDEWHHVGTPAAEEDGINGNAFWIFPFLCDHWTLFRRCGEAGVRVGCRATGLWIPWPSQPIDQFGRFVICHALPPDVAVRGYSAVREN